MVVVWICRNLDGDGLDLHEFGFAGRKEGCRNLDLQGRRKGAWIWIYREGRRVQWSRVLTQSRATLTTPRLGSMSWTWQQLRYRRREESVLAMVDVVRREPAGVARMGLTCAMSATNRSFDENLTGPH